MGGGGIINYLKNHETYVWLITIRMSLRQGRWLLFLSSSRHSLFQSWVSFHSWIYVRPDCANENILTKTPDAQNSSKKGERYEIKTKTEMSSLTLHQGLHNSLFVGGENVGPAGRLRSLLLFEEILKLWIKSMLRSWQWMLCSLECTYMDDKYRETI